MLESPPCNFSSGIECEDFRRLNLDRFGGRQALTSAKTPVIVLRRGQGVSIRASEADPGTSTFRSTSPYPDHDSYGHDVETAYLMLEAEDVLGNGHDPNTEHMAKMLVDHALANGGDETYGGFFQDGTTFGKPESKLKEWWVQMDGLNSLLLMHEKYGKQADAYFKAFQRQWQFIKTYQIDNEFHGVYEMVAPDGNPVNLEKGQIWKAAYHDGRALLNVSERLRKLAGAEGK